MKTIEIPQNIEAERIVLGSMMRNIDHLNTGYQELTEEYFFLPENKEIFLALGKFYKENKAADLQYLSKLLEWKDKDALEYVTTMCYEAFSGIDFDSYCSDIEDCYKLRKILLHTNDALHKACSEKANPDFILSELQNSLGKVSYGQKAITKSLKDIFNNFSEHGNFIEHLQWLSDQHRQGLSPFIGVPSRYRNLDDVIGFFKPGLMTLIGARTSMGKTTFVLNLMANMIRDPAIRIGFFSLEMAAEIVIAKLISIYADIKFSVFDFGKFNYEEHHRLVEAAKMLHDKPLFIEDPSAITIDALRTRAKRMVDNHGIEILFIDYLTRIKTKKGHSRHAEVDEVSKALQSLARELNIPIICLAQLNRGSLSNKNHVPTISDFRESGSIEEDADNVFLLHRPEYYDPNDKPGEIQLIIPKNRVRGITTTLKFSCDKNRSERYTEYVPLERQIDEETKQHFKEFSI